MKINQGSSILMKNLQYLQNKTLENKLDFKNFFFEKIKEIDNENANLKFLNFKGEVYEFKTNP